HKIEGNVYVDASLMPDGEHEGGTGVTMSSIMVNDNVIDLTARPGAKAGDPAELVVSPQTSYIHFTNKMITGLANSRPMYDASDPVEQKDGALEVTLVGTVPLGGGVQTVSFPVVSPTQFATAALRDALKAKGVEIKPKKAGGAAENLQTFQRFYTGE